MTILLREARAWVDVAYLVDWGVNLSTKRGRKSRHHLGTADEKHVEPRGMIGLDAVGGRAACPNRHRRVAHRGLLVAIHRKQTQQASCGVTLMIVESAARREALKLADEAIESSVILDDLRLDEELHVLAEAVQDDPLLEMAYNEFNCLADEVFVVVEREVEQGDDQVGLTVPRNIHLEECQVREVRM